mmetsp:Transcript_46795/g.115928  ORF Transcript_46795/g.115928 Transcript_46795/m.115928 type:complete len:223 (+) Transcript_46795:156-824(+)
MQSIGAQNGAQANARVDYAAVAHSRRRPMLSHLRGPARREAWEAECPMLPKAPGSGATGGKAAVCARRVAPALIAPAPHAFDVSRERRSPRHFALDASRRFVRRNKDVVFKLFAERLEAAEWEVVQIRGADRDARDVRRGTQHEAADVVDRRLQRYRVYTAFGGAKVAVEQLLVDLGADRAVINCACFSWQVPPLRSHLGGHAALIRGRQQRVLVLQVFGEA